MYSGPPVPNIAVSMPPTTPNGTDSRGSSSLKPRLNSRFHAEYSSTNKPSNSSSGRSGANISSARPEIMPTSTLGISLRNSPTCTWLRLRMPSRVPATRSKNRIIGTAVRSGTICVSSGIAMMEEPKPVSPKIV